VRFFKAILRGVRSNYWLVPTGIIGVALGLAYLMLKLDGIFPTQYVLNLGWIYTRDPAGARALLSVTAESTITVAGVVFSITTVAMTFASNQFGTRVLRNFIHDFGSQAVLGIFLGTFVYCLVVMRRVEGQFVPSLSVAVGIFLAIGSTLILVYFIHHVILTMEAETVVATVAADLTIAIDTLFPEKLGTGKNQVAEKAAPNMPADFGENSELLLANKQGFITSIASNKLLELMTEHDMVMQILVGPGQFVFDGLPLARLWPRDRFTEDVQKRLRSTIEVGRQRTYYQDVAFAFQQMVLLTTRSLSPGINALGTAMDSIERIGAAFVMVGGRTIPSGWRYDENSRLRVVAPPVNLSDLADQVLHPIRQNAATQPEVLMRLIAVIGWTMQYTDNEELQRSLRRHLAWCRQAAHQFPQAADRWEAEQTYSKAADGPAA
jgi:uncharacterized membrane protein